jgi:hypothetical protein
MFQFPRKDTFRRLILLAIALQIVAMTFTICHWVSGGRAARTALQWAGYGSFLPYNFVYWWGQLFQMLFTIGLLFFFFFHSWSRIFLLGLLLLSVVLVPFSGLRVYDAQTAFLYDIANLVYWVPFLLSFFPPCSEYFKKSGDV